MRAGTRGVLENIRHIRHICHWGVSYDEAVRTHFLCRTAHDNIASLSIGSPELKPQRLEGAAEVDGRELLRDVRAHDLQGQRHGHELPGLLTVRTAEVHGHQLLLQARRLILAVMLRQRRHLLGAEPVLVAVAQQAVGLAEDAAVVEEPLARR